MSEQINQTISVGGIRYKVEYIKDSNKNVEYVMLRSYAFKNNVLYDTNLYFVEKDLFSSFIYKKQSSEADNETKNENLTSGLLFPAVSVNGSAITLDIRQFNQDFNPQYFDEHSTDIMNSPLVYHIYKRNNNTFTESPIPCSTLKIYKPAASKLQNNILHLYSYINKIKVHILCRDISWYENNEHESNYIRSIKELNEHHDFYTTYIELSIPELDTLFNGSYYYKENLNVGDIATFDISTKEGEKLYEKWKNCICNQYISLGAFEIPFSIEKQSTDSVNNNSNNNSTNINGSVYSAVLSNNTVVLVADKDSTDSNIIEEAIYVKHYIPDLMHTNRAAQLTHALTIQFIPYDNSYKYIYNKKEIVYGFGDSKCLILSDDYETSTTQLFKESRIKLKSRIGFDENGQISIINEFEYPNKENKSKFPTFIDAYEYWNGVDLSEYTDIVDDEDEDGWWDPDYGENMQCGVIFEIFTDKFTKDRIYKESYGFNAIAIKENRKPQIDDFTFSLGGLFTSWKQWPGVMFCRCTFIDKYIGKKLYGSICTITKEQFKYMLCMDEKNQQITTTGSTIIYKETPDWYNDTILREDNVMDKSRFNILNNIRVNVIAPTTAPTNDVTDIANNNTATGTTKVIYKPIFYKVHDVNSIRLRSGLTQNVGVNLMDWMTKVETFKMSINSVILTEYARNDNYVIFNIETDKITTATDETVTSGDYHILNQDGEYITSGSWSVI